VVELHYEVTIGYNPRCEAKLPAGSYWSDWAPFDHPQLGANRFVPKIVVYRFVPKIDTAHDPDLGQLFENHDTLLFN
jgi:hypothetical protein